MSQEDSDFFFSVSGQKIKVNPYTTAQRSTTILGEINKTLQHIFDGLINNESINPESINDYFKLQENPDFQFSTQNLQDLCFLASYFQHSDLLQFLHKCIQDHFNTVEIVIQELKTYKKNFEKNQHHLAYLKMLSDFIIDRINEFLEHKEFEKVSSKLISAIFSFWEQKPDHKQFSHDLLFGFINKDLENRHSLFAFIQLELLSKPMCSELIDTCFTALGKKSNGFPYYYDDLKFPVVYLYNLKLEQISSDSRNQTSKSKLSHATPKIRKSTSDFTSSKNKSLSVDKPKSKPDSEVKSSKLVNNIKDESKGNAKPDTISNDTEIEKRKNSNENDTTQQKPAIPNLMISQSKESFPSMKNKIKKSATSVRLDRDYTLLIGSKISSFPSQHRLSTISPRKDYREPIHFALEEQQLDTVRQILLKDPSKVNMKTI